MNQSLSIENQAIEPLQSLYLSPIQRAIVKYLSWTPSAMSALKKRFPERNAHVLKKDIQYMMRVGMVERTGSIYSIVHPVEAQPVDNQIDRMASILKEYDIDDIDLPKEETVTLIKIVNGFEQDKATSYTLLTKNVKNEIQSIENQRDDNRDIYACWSAIIGNNDDTIIHLKKVNQKGAFCGFGQKILLRCGGEPVSMSDANLSYQKLCEECKKVALDKVQNIENDPTKGNLEIKIIPKGKTQDIESQAVSPLNASNEKQDMIRTALKNTLLNSGKPTTEISKKGNISKTEISSFKNGTRNISLDRCLELTCKLGLTTYFLNHLQRGINDRLSEINGTKFKTTKTQLNLF